MRDPDFQLKTDTQNGTLRITNCRQDGGAPSGSLTPAKSRSAIRILPGWKLNFGFRGTETDAEHGDSVRPAREWMTSDILISVPVFGWRQRIDELPRVIGPL